LERTLGVVLFQEQILRLAMELGNFSAAEADELRRAIGFTRSQERLNRAKDKLGIAFQKNGVAPEAVTYLLNSLASFALYGFPESHAISFALIAYASAWLKVHRPAAFYAALLNNQPMGFYSPASLVQDARRHNIRVLPVCVQVSGEKCVVEADDAVRLGLTSLTKMRKGPIQKLVAARAERPFLSLTDFLRRTDFNPNERRLLSASGALNALASHRRAALWQVEALQPDDELFICAAEGEEQQLSPLERMTLLERIQADYATMSLTTGAHPMKLLRATLNGVCPADKLKDLPNGAPVKVAGAVITRQRPGTAKGFCFITLEDETGHANAIVRPTLFEQARLVINLVPALQISGRLQNEQGVIHIMAEKIVALTSGDLPSEASHDYH